MLVTCGLFACKDDPSEEVKPAQAVTGASLTPGFQQLTLSWTNPDPDNVEYVEISYTDVNGNKQTVRFDIKGAATSTYSFEANDLKTFEVTLITVTKDGQRSSPVTVSGTAKVTSKYDAILETVNVAAYGDFGVRATWENTAQTAANVVISYNGQTVQCNALTESEKLFENLASVETAFTVEIVNGDEKCSAPKIFLVTPLNLQARVDELLRSVNLQVGDPVDYQSYNVWVLWNNTIEVEAEITLDYGAETPLTYNTSESATGSLTLEDGAYEIVITVANAGGTSATKNVPLNIGSLPFNGPHNVSLSTVSVIDAIDFDEGGEGFAFHDSDDVNTFGENAYRETAVDIQTDDAGSTHIGQVGANEWLVYTVNAEQAGTYQVDMLFSSHSQQTIEIGKNNPGYIHLDVNGVNATGNVAVPDGYSWTIFRWMPVRKVSLNAGKNKIRLNVSSANMNIKALRFSAAPVEPTLIASWNFENESDLTQAATGSSPLKFGKYLSENLSEIPNNDANILTRVAGPADNNPAVLLPEAYFFFLDQSHGITANGGGSRMNEYTLVVDFMIPVHTGWLAVVQTDADNASHGSNWWDGDSEIFANAASHGFGWVNWIEYMQSNDAVFDGVWYRYVISAACGGKWFTQYLNGRMFNAGPIPENEDKRHGDYGSLDGKLSFDPAGLILFGDNDGESADVHVAGIRLYNGPLSRDEVEALGGFTTGE
jgi:hypothetical protein